MADQSNNGNKLTRGVLTNDGSRLALNLVNDLFTPNDSGDGYRKDIVVFVRDEDGSLKETHTRKKADVRYLNK